MATPNPIDQETLKNHFNDYLTGRYGEENVLINAVEFTAHTDQHTDQHNDQHVDSGGGPDPILP
jgi:hypothetical protein